MFAAPGAPATLSTAARRRLLDVVEAPNGAVAGVLAAVTGEVSDAPGAMLAGLEDAGELVRGLAHAQRDRAPLIAITDAGADVGLLAPVVKGSLVVEPGSAGHWIAHAANLAMKDPRGPVHLVVDARIAGASALPVATSCRPGPLPPPERASLDAFAAVLAAADRPLVVTGLECSADDARWIRSFVETLPAPVLATTKGRGALSEPHPLALGGLAVGHPALVRADLIVLVGVDAGEWPPSVMAADARVIRIGRAAWPDGGFATEVLGDVALTLEELAPAVRARAAADWDVAELDRLKRAVRQSATASPSARLVALAREATPAGTLATGDVPALAAWQAVAPRETLTPLGMAPPGYAILAAVATQLTHTDRRVVAFTTAGGLGAAAPALTWAAARRLSIVVVVLDAVDPPAGTIDGTRIEIVATRHESDFAPSFSRAFQSGRPAVCLARLEPGDRV